MDVNLLRTRLLEVLAEKNLRPTELAKRIKRRHPDIEFGHQFVLNIANGRNKRRIDLNKWQYVLEELQMTQEEFDKKTTPISASDVENVIGLLAAGEAIGSFVLDQRKKDAQLLCLTSHLVAASQRVNATLSVEQSRRVQLLAAAIQQKCDASWKGAESAS